jgi:hypothetical protein
MRYIQQARWFMGADRNRGIDKHLPLRRVEFHILLSLAAGERHGYGIIQDIEARGETSVPDVGTALRRPAFGMRRNPNIFLGQFLHLLSVHKLVSPLGGVIFSPKENSCQEDRDKS